MLTVVFLYIKFCFLLKNMLQNIITEKIISNNEKLQKKMTSEKKKTNKHKTDPLSSIHKVWFILGQIDFDTKNIKKPSHYINQDPTLMK